MSDEAWQAIWVYVARQPSPRGDCTSNPTSALTVSRAPPSVKCRIRCHHSPSVEAWNAYAPRIPLIRSHTADPSTVNPLASSERPMVTTDTIIGWPWGDSSKHSLAQVSSPAQSSSTPAS